MCVNAPHSRTNLLRPLRDARALSRGRFGPRRMLLRSSAALVVSRAALLSMSAAGGTKQMAIDPFVIRQFDDKTYTGTRINYDKVAFETKMNELYDSGLASLVDGYAPFCKHLFVPNFVGAKLNYLEITPENESCMRSGYEARTDKELPVLVRWFPANLAPPAPVAKYLDVILYSREQIQKETAAMGKEEDGETAPWGIISIKAQDVDYELPMQPITMMRNALGAEEGGSGVGLDRDKYTESVEFWSKHAPIK